MFTAFRAWIAFVLVVFGFIYFAALGYSQKFDERASQIAEQATREFVDLTRSKGYVDNRDYKEFLEKLDSSGKTYDVVMEYSKKIYQPLYGDPNDFYTFTETYEVMYDRYYTQDILDVLFPTDVVLPDDAVERRFNMRAGDIFTVRIQGMDEDLTSRIVSIFHPINSSFDYYSDGGMVSEAP